MSATRTTRKTPHENTRCAECGWGRGHAQRCSKYRTNCCPECFWKRGHNTHCSKYREKRCTHCGRQSRLECQRCPYCRRGRPIYPRKEPVAHKTPHRLPAPTEALPGTAEKFRVIEERAARGENLWNEKDSVYDLE